MSKAKIIEKLIEEKGHSIHSFATKCEIPETTLYTLLKRDNVGNSGTDVIIKICHGLGITVEQLYEMDNNTFIPSFESTINDIEKFIIKNRHEISDKQKLRLIQMLSEI